MANGISKNAEWPKKTSKVITDTIGKNEKEIGRERKRKEELPSA